MRNNDGGSTYQGNPVLEISTLLEKNVLADNYIDLKIIKKNIKKEKGNISRQLNCESVLQE